MQIWHFEFGVKKITGNFLDFVVTRKDASHSKHSEAEFWPELVSSLTRPELVRCITTLILVNAFLLF